MTARLDWSRWGLALTMAGAACAVGLLAGYDPGLAIVASLGIAFVILTVADLTIGLVSFAAISTVDYASSASGSFSVTKLLGLLLAASWLAVITTRPTARTDFIRTHPYLFGLIGLFLTWALVSFVWAEDAGASLASTQRWALNFVLFLIVFTAVRTPQQARWVGYSFLAGAAVVAVIGLANGPDPSGEGRLATAGLDPNELAAILVAGIVLGLGLAAAARGRLATRCATLILVAVCTSTLMLTASRGGLIALTVAMLAGVIMAKHWRIQIALAAFAIALTGYYYFATVATPEARERLVSTTEGEQRVLQGRTTIWHVGWRTFEANPVVGVGDGNFGVSSRHYLLETGAVGRSDQILQETPAAHNAYLQVGAELGLIGELLFGAVLVACIASALAAARAFDRAGNRQMAIYSAAVAVSIIAFLAACFFISEQQSKQLWLLVALAPALRTIATTSMREPSAA